jgi:hypothetical protein
MYRVEIQVDRAYRPYKKIVSSKVMRLRPCRVVSEGVSRMVVLYKQAIPNASYDAGDQRE